MKDNFFMVLLQMIKRIYKWLHLVHLVRIEYLTITLFLFFGNVWLFPTIILFLFRKLVTMDHFDHTSVRQYKEVHTGSLLLKYENGIPCATFFDTDPYDRGFTHGKYFASYITKLSYMTRFLRLFKKFPSNITVPELHRMEIKGLVDGYNSTKPLLLLTENIAITWHLLPMACTSILQREDDSIIFGRNMDWVPYGNLARNSILLRFNGISSFTIPGIIGVVTGWNKDGLVLAMNVCPTETVKGIPSLFYNRLLLQSCKTPTEVKLYTETSVNQPLGMYHVTVTNKNEGLCVSFFQGRESNGSVPLHFYREFSDILKTFNYRFFGDEKLSERFFSDAREKEVNSLFEKGEKIENIMASYPVNNWITCNTLLFNLSKNCVYIGFDNGYSASSNLRRIRIN